MGLLGDLISQHEHVIECLSKGTLIEFVTAGGHIYVHSSVQKKIGLVVHVEEPEVEFFGLAEAFEREAER